MNLDDIGREIDIPITSSFDGGILNIFFAEDVSKYTIEDLKLYVMETSLLRIVTISLNHRIRFLMEFICMIQPLVTLEDTQLLLLKKLVN